MHRVGLGLLLGLTASFPAVATPVPDTVAAMIRAAADTGDAATLKTTADLARKTNPDCVAEIDALVASLQKAADDKKMAQLKSQGFFQGWKGQGQAGGYLTTGNTKSKGFSLGLNLNKEGIRWRHTITGSVDYARQDGATSTNREFASYEGNYKFNDRLYALGLASWEHDRFSGYDRRFSEAIGMGYTLIKSPDMTLSLEAGPALRQTRYITGDSDNELAGRAALDYSWTINPGILLTENATYYGQSGDSTLTSTTALTLKVKGALSVQASFLVNHESNPPVDLEKTNTISRFSLVYGF